MSSDTTIFEAPLTPAPVFAYRALRGLFFASPASSPEQNAHDNKENIPDFRLSPSKIAFDPPTKRSSTPLQHRTNANLSSPTKSILRTPGLVTPRTRKVREINVKFKSVSPEVRLRDASCKISKVKISTPIEKRALQTKIHPEAATEGVNAKVKLDPYRDDDMQTLLQGGSHVNPVPATAGEFDIAGYMRRTEREMKKLVRYGQKMREYARKQDEENVRLKRLVDDLKTENERLSQSTTGAASADRTRKPAPRAELQKAAMDNKLQQQTIRAPHKSNGQMHPDPQSFETKTNPNPSTKSTTAIPSSSTTRRSHQDPLTTERPKLNPSSQSQECVRLDVPTPSSTTTLSRPSEHDRKRQTPNPMVYDGLKTTQKEPPRSTGPGSARLSVDKVVAARERLRRKAELRKASVESDRNHGLDGGGSGGGGGGGNDSQVDWAGL